MTGVAVIDDHPLYRQGLAVAIEQAPEMELVLAARSVEDFDGHSGLRPDVVILDLHLPGLEGSQAVAHLCERGLAVLVVSASDDQEAVLDAMAAGASGYLTKDAEASEITTAVAAIAGGGTYVSPALAAYLLRVARTQPKAVPWALSEREREILRLLASGRPTTTSPPSCTSASVPSAPTLSASGTRPDAGVAPTSPGSPSSRA
jgi:DNA-binding NarL/FixJ family response regulator